MYEKISKICLGIGIIVIIISLFILNEMQYANVKLATGSIYFSFFMEVIALILKQQKLSKRKLLIMGIYMVVIWMIGYAVYRVAVTV